MPGWQRTFDSLISTTRIRTVCLGAVLLGVLLVFYFTRTRNDSSDSAPKSPNVEAVQHQIAPLKLAAMSSRHSEQHTLNLKGLDLTHPAIPDAITKLKEKRSVTEHTLKIEVGLPRPGLQITRFIVVVPLSFLLLPPSSPYRVQMCFTVKLSLMALQSSRYSCCMALLSPLKPG